MWKWILVALILIIGVLYFRRPGKDIPFIGLKPFYDPQYSHYLNAFNYEEEEVVKNKELTIPTEWDFTAIVGDKKRERITRHVIETLYQKKFPSIRPEWLINPLTGHRLEIDCYNEEESLGIEVNGEQHYKQGHFHKDRDVFLRQVQRDTDKKSILTDQGVDLIVVPYTVKINDIPYYIIEKLTALGRM